MCGGVALKLIWTFPAGDRTMDVRRRNCSAIPTSSLWSIINAPNNNGLISQVRFVINPRQTGIRRSRLTALLCCCFSKPFIPRAHRRELAMLRTNRASRYFGGILHVPGTFMSVATSCIWVGERGLFQLIHGWVHLGCEIDAFTGFTLAPHLGRPTRLFELIFRVARLHP